MPKKFCINTKGLTSAERKEFATELDKFVSKKKTQIEKSRKSKGDDE